MFYPADPESELVLQEFEEQVKALLGEGKISERALRRISRDRLRQNNSK